MENNIGIVEQIHFNMNKFTKTEKKVAEYIAANPSNVIENTVVELAEKSNCSEASIIRFCKNMGYKGYQDFKIMIAKSIVDPYKHLSTVLEKNDSLDSIMNKMFTNLITTLEQNRNIIHTEEMERAVEAILHCRRLEIFGSGGSSIVASDAQHKFLKIGIKAGHYSDADMQLMSADLLEEGDVALGISISGTNSGTTDCLKIAKKEKATTIALTTVGKAPIMKYSDIAIKHNSRETLFKSESSSGRIAQLAIIDILVAAISLREYNGAYQAIQKTREATSSRKY